MPYISPQFIAYLRSQVASVLTDSCLIERNTEATDNKYGSKKQTWVTVAQDVPCRMTVLNRSNRSLVEAQASQEVMFDSYQLVLAYDAPLERDYRVTVNDEVYQVTRIESQLTDSGFKQALLIRRR